MAATYIVPLQAGRPQSLTIALSGVTYALTLRWLDAADLWLMDIADAIGAQVVAGVPLLPGADLLAQYAYLGLPGQFWVSTDSDPNAPPGFASLGDTTHLYYVEP